MENKLYGDYEQTKEKLNKGEDEVIISDFLRLMIDNGFSWPGHIKEEEDMFNMIPNELLSLGDPLFMIVKARREACGSKSDACEYGCWRIMGGDKLIKSKETGKLLGYKKILKFCISTKPREYKRSWVMEEYRLANKWKQDHVMCKIRLMFETEIRFLLAKHSSRLLKLIPSDSLPTTVFFPAYEVCLSFPKDKDVYYLENIIDSGENSWPEEVTNDVYYLDPLTLVDLHDDMFLLYGICFFANRPNTFGITYTWRSGSWKIIKPDRPIYSRTGVLGYKRGFKFYEKEKRRHFLKGSEMEVTFSMEEYRLAERTDREGKVLCVISAETRIIQ